MKSYTDLEQSKKLAEFLPRESADFRYRYTIDHFNNVCYSFEPTPCWNSEHDILCWSLAALYNLLPNNENEETTLSKGCWNAEPFEYLDNWWCDYENDSEKFSLSADNSIDACAEMILKLHELNLL